MYKSINMYKGIKMSAYVFLFFMIAGGCSVNVDITGGLPSENNALNPTPTPGLGFTPSQDSQLGVEEITTGNQYKVKAQVGEFVSPVTTNNGYTVQPIWSQ